MEALRGAMELVKDLDAEVCIVHVVAPHFALLDKMRERARETLMLEEAEEKLARIKKDDLGDAAQPREHPKTQGPRVSQMNSWPSGLFPRRPLRTAFLKSTRSQVASLTR
jgi:hypothetical protein